MKFRMSLFVHESIHPALTNHDCNTRICSAERYNTGLSIQKSQKSADSLNATSSNDLSSNRISRNRVLADNLLISKRQVE